MGSALALARRGLGLTWPNPSVGCVIVDAGGRVVGRGVTAPGGRPHAEPQALAQAGAAARGGTAYVTLEPCAHVGATPSCATTLGEGGVARCVIALEDPDPRTAGKGAARLREAGVTVEMGLRAAEAEEATLGFLTRARVGRPAFLLKSAMTIDGRIATRTGESKWITGEPARAFGYLLRAQCDAILVGIGTAIADDPMLDVRLAGLEDRRPVRLVADARLRLPLTSKLARSAARQPLWILTRQNVDADRAAGFRSIGAEVIGVPTLASGELDLGAAAQELGRRGLTRVLVEGGGRIAAALLREALIDRLYAFRAGRAIGGDGLPAVASMGLDLLAGAPHFQLSAVRRLGEDVLETWRAAA